MSNDINPSQKSLNECNPKSPVPPDVNLDVPPPECFIGIDEENKRQPNDQSLNWLKDNTNKKVGLGSRMDCDPMQTGQIVNDLENVNRNYIYRYSKSLRGTDEAIRDMFTNVVVIDEDGKAWPVPIILGTPEKAVAAIVQDNVRKDETLVVDRIKLPMMAVTRTGINYDYNRYVYHRATDKGNHLRADGKPGYTASEKYTRDTVYGFARGVPVDLTYTLTAWTMYAEDMNQILEQILLKFSHAAYIRVTGVPWEVIVKLDSIANNGEPEPGDQKIRVVKYEFNITTQSYIPQPIERKKAVLKMNLDFVDGMTEDEITEVMARIEEAVKELEC